jgi:hypothetical protein
MLLIRMVALGLLLTACGGGGGDGSTRSSEVLPGTYRGTANLTASATAGSATASVSDSGPIVLVVSPDQTVTIGSFPGSAPISGNEFTHTVPASTLNSSELTCPRGTISFHGVFAGTTVNGTMSSDGVQCNGVAMVFTGDYTATLQAEVRRNGQDVDGLKVWRDAILRVLTAP